MKKAKKTGSIMKRIIAFVLVLALLPAGRTEFAYAADIKSVNIHVRYGQSEARTLLGMVNSLRQSSVDAWYWKEGSSEKVECKNLRPLVYDYGLEEAAMKRAAEIALVYGHDRPDGRHYWTVFEDCAITPGASAENLAVGYSDASAVNTAWTEANEKYEGQGHRRNILNGKYTAMGVGHAKYNGRDYWVQLFSEKAPRTTLVPADDSEAIVYGIGLDSSQIQVDRIDTTSIGSAIGLDVGGTKDLSAVYESVKLDGHFRGTLAEEYCPLRQTLEMSVANTSIATISGNTLRAVANGRTTLNIQCTLGGATVSVPVYVGQGAVNEDMSLQKATVDPIPDQRYTGYTITPPVTVRMNNAVLRLYTDYLVDYGNNLDTGTATVRITGIGQYKGMITTSFLIYGQSISGATIDPIPDQNYTGYAIYPRVTVRLGSSVLMENKDYTLAYYNNTNAGTATVSVIGKGGYSGSRTAAFKIIDTDISRAAVTIANKVACTGNYLTPNVQVSMNGLTLYQNVDYVVNYEDNLVPGRARVVLTGIGSYTGTRIRTFIIVPKKQKISSAKASGRKVTLSWREDGDADGYTVYRSASPNSGFKNIASYGRSGRTRYKSGTMARRTYYYKVRSYVVVDGKKYYGAYSAVKTVRVR